MSKHQRDEYFKERVGTDEVVPHDEENRAVKTEGVDEPQCTTDSKSKAKKLKPWYISMMKTVKLKDSISMKFSPRVL